MQLLPHTDSPRRLVLLRHGRTEWNRTSRAQGHADVPLDDVGRGQARVAAAQLAAYEPVFVWSSDLARARETAERLVAVTGHELVLDKRLREYDVGGRQGMIFEQFEAAHPDVMARLRAGQRPDVPGAETDQEVGARMVEALGEAAAAVEKGQTGIVVGHGASLRTGLLSFLGVPLRLREMLSGRSNCAWTVLERRPHRGWQITDYNARNLPEPLDLADDLGSR